MPRAAVRLHRATWRRTGAATARGELRRRGWVAHHNTDLWRQTAPVGDYGHGDPVWAIWPMGGAWLCQHLWEHYAFGGDAAFLRERAYPLMRGAAEFCLDWLIEDGRARSSRRRRPRPRTSSSRPTAQPAAVSMAATMDLAIDLGSVHATASRPRTCSASTTRVRDRLEAGARAAASRTAIGARGQLQEWSRGLRDGPSRTTGTSRICSACIPGRQITPRRTPELFAAARRSLELRGDGGTGWSMAWKINFWARLRDGDHAYRLLANLLKLVDARRRTCS